MPRKQKAVTLSSIATIVVLGILTVPMVAMLKSFMNRPLGPSLGYPTHSAPAAQNETPPPGSVSSILPTPPAAVPTSGAQPLCGGPKVMNILAIGSDYRYNTYLYGLSDVIMTIRVDFVTPKVTVLDFPRDLYVEIPDISQHGGITHGKLNQPFLYGNPGLGYYDGPGEGPGLLARTLDLNYGERPDHYVAITMQVFVKLVDAVGGVDVELPDWELGKSPGVHHMDGAQALTFARERPDGTFERTKRQDYILAAFWKKLSDPSVIMHAGSIVSAFYGSAETDLTPTEINRLTCVVRKLPKGNVEFLSWPPGMFTGTRIHDPVLGNTFIWDVNNDLIRDYVAAFNNGQWPETPPISTILTPSPLLHNP
ncbi:MAG TPA: LCP family protein [Anaerolineales bacterium]|nr:LCP family protein [Anaerolineales bacterium]